MRALKILTVVMAVMIVAGVIVLGITISKRMNAPRPVANAGLDAPARLPNLLDEPAGTSIAQISAAADHVVLLLHGGGPDRIVVLDARDGTISARSALAH